MRIAVLSDIHSNLVALDAVLAHAGEVDAIWHLGDVVGYGPDPDGVVARLAERGAVGARGNHDAAATGAIDADWFNPEARAAIEWTALTITGSTRAWLAALPERDERGDWTLVHGSPRDPTWEYVTSASIARAGFDALETRLGLHGHTHVPVAWTEEDGQIGMTLPTDGTSAAVDGRRLLVNPGSVGQPRDGDPRASYLMLDPDAGTMTWHRVRYDHNAVAVAMRSLGLPARLADRLRYGW